MNNKLLLPLLIPAVSFLSAAHGQFVLDFAQGGSPASTVSYTVDFTDGAPTIGSNLSSFTDPGLSGSLGDLNGSITFTFSGYGEGVAGDGGINFDENTGTWSAGSTANLVPGNPVGTGLGDAASSGNDNLSGVDEGIFIQLTFSDGLNPSDVLLTGWDLANNGVAEDNTRMVEVTTGGPGIAGSGNVFGGVVTDASISLTDGKYFLATTAGGGAGRLQSLTFVAVPEPSSIALIFGGIITLGLFARRMRK